MTTGELTGVGHAKLQLNESVRKLEVAVNKGEYEKVKGLLNEIEDRTAEVKLQAAMHLAGNLLEAAWAVVTREINERGNPGHDGLDGMPFRTSLHYGDEGRRWYYLGSSKVPGLMVRVKLEVVASTQDDEDRRNGKLLH